jgi:LysM repeat protein
MYYFYLDGVLLPVTPSKLSIKVKNNNKTLTLINEGEINLLKEAGLTDIEFDVLLPNHQHPFAIYEGGFQGSAYFTNKLEQLKVDKQPFQFIVTRELPNGQKMFDNNITVSMESYTLKEDAKSYGFDVLASIKLKQYKEFKVKTYTTNAGKASVRTQRETKNAPAPKKTPATYSVVSGDTLWKLAKKYYGDGSKYPVIAKANNIANPNLILVGQKLTIPVLN